MRDDRNVIFINSTQSDLNVEMFSVRGKINAISTKKDIEIIENN